MASLCGLLFDISVTGDCSNTSSGSFSVSIYGNAPDYTIQFISPTTDVYYLGNNVTATTFTSLSAGTYVFEVIDSCLTAGTPNIGSAYISSGTTVTLTGLENTVNNLSNGAITAQTSNYYGFSSFYLYDYDYGYITSGGSSTDEFIFYSLSAATYYVVANDGGGCTGRSESVIVKSSSTFDYGFYIVDDSGCGRNTGKVFVTGLTGSDPYTYSWGNGATTSSISGLTAGNYRVTVTDKDGAVITKQATVNSAPKLGYVNAVITPPSCYSDDGTINFIISGGTAPYNYELSNGVSSISYLENIVIPNVASGNYTMTVTDAGSCVLRQKFSVLSPRGFSVVSINKRNTICGTNQGLIQIQLIGGTPNYIYTLIDENNREVTYTSSSPSQVFSNLYSGVYTLNISDLGPCTYSEIIEIESTTSFGLNYEVTDTTCDNEFGSVTVEIIGDGLPPYTYRLSGQPKVTKNLKTNTFDNLREGTYLLSVTDSSGCTENQNLSVNSSTKLNFNLFTQKTISGNDGKIDLYITDGTPPFTITWGDNVSEQTGTTISNLSAGTYSVTVSDANGCTQYRTANVDGQNLISSYQTYNICDNNIVDSGQVTKKGLRQMLLEGFYDLTVGDNNCVLNQAIFSAIVDLSGTTTSTNFYTTESLDDYPSDNDFYDVVEQTLLSIPGIDNVVFDSNTNQVTINTGCVNQTVSLQDTDITVSVNISYDITCESCDGVSILGFFPVVILDGILYGYDPENNLYIPLPESELYTNAIGFAKNNENTKLWVLNYGGIEIFEYDISSLVPFSISYNKTITLTSQVSGSLVCSNPTTLLSSNNNSNYISSIDISTGVVTDGIFMSTTPFTVLDNSMLVNSSNNLIVITNDIDGFQYLRQYDQYSNLQIQISLPASLGYTMYEYDSTFYLVDLSNNQVYSMLSVSPYTLTPEFILEFPISASNPLFSQNSDTVTTNFVAYTASTLCFDYSFSTSGFTDTKTPDGDYNGFPYYNLTNGVVWSDGGTFWYWTGLIGDTGTTYGSLYNGFDSIPDSLSYVWNSGATTQMNSSLIGSCVTPTPTPIIGVTPTITPTITQTQTPTPTPTVTITNTVTPSITLSTSPSATTFCFDYTFSAVGYTDTKTPDGVYSGYSYYNLTNGVVWSDGGVYWYWADVLGNDSTYYDRLYNGAQSTPNSSSYSWDNPTGSTGTMNSSLIGSC